MYNFHYILLVFLLPPHFFQKKEVGLWFNPDSYRDRLGEQKPANWWVFCILCNLKVFSMLFDFPPFFPKKEVGPWFNPDSYRDRLGSKNLPIGGFFAFYAYRNKSLRRLKSNLKAILKQQKPIHAGFLSHFFIFHYLLNLHHFL
jgi:hypothetical protein